VGETAEAASAWAREDAAFRGSFSREFARLGSAIMGRAKGLRKRARDGGGGGDRYLRCDFKWNEGS